MKKIDIHCHTTNRIISEVVHPYCTPSQIMIHMDSHDIEYTVLLTTYFPHKGTGISNFRLLRWIQMEETKRFFMFGSLDFETYFLQGLNELNELSEKSLIKGIKIYTGYQNIDLDSVNFGKVMELAERRKLPVMFHAGYSYASMRKYGKTSIGPMYGAKQLRKVAEKWPAIDFIFSHMSKPFFHEMLFAAKECQNVYTDISGLIDSKFDEKEIPVCIEEIRLFLKECGSKKLLFGTDFPVQTHEHSVMFIEEAMKDRSMWEKENVYYNNAVDILNL